MSLDGLVVVIRSPLGQDERRQAVSALWAHDLRVLGALVVFSVASPSSTLLTSGRFLETRCLDRHDDLTPRAIEILRWFLKETSETHLYMLDDDCYVAADRLAALPWRPWDYAGHFNAPWYVSGGPGVILSRKAAALVLEYLQRDDTAIGAVLTICMPDAVKFDLAPWFRPWMEQEAPAPHNHIVVKHYVRTPEEMRLIHAALDTKDPSDHKDPKAGPRDGDPFPFDRGSRPAS